MRRALAVLLVLAFSLPLIAPAVVSASVESSLPACCRRDGKHHCAMQSESMQSGAMTVSVSRRLVTVSENCPCWPFARLALMLPHALSTSAPPVVDSLFAGPAAAAREAAAGYRVSCSRSRQKRGPPPSIAL